MSSHDDVSLQLRDGEICLRGKRPLLDLSFESLSLPEGWRVETGNWTPTAHGLVGAIASDSAAVIWCGQRFPDELALVLEAEAMPGHDNDANAFFRAVGSIYGDEEHDVADCTAWILGTAGWYVHDHGLEKHPHGPTWRVPGGPLIPGAKFRVAAGYRAGHVFLWKDGDLLIEREDPKAEQGVPHDRIGLGTWNSSIRFLRLSVYDLGLSEKS